MNILTGMFIAFLVLGIGCLFVFAYSTFALYYLKHARVYYETHEYDCVNRPWRVWLADVLFLRLL